MTGEPAGAHVYRVEWVPGTDHLLGVCFCRAQHVSDDPVALWEWLHGHPQGHDVLPVQPGPNGQLLTRGHDVRPVDPRPAGELKTGVTR